tara:strand:+ start:821 stop:1690 length:870 start_codon:yes stop_codon:yes gene_type:complete
MPELVGKIVLGTVQLGMDYGVTNSYGKPEKLEAIKILETAWEGGIRRFDTAPGYGSEEILGEFIRINGIQNEIKVLTKIPSLKNKKNYQLSIKSSLEESLDKLKSKIEVLFFHDSEDSKLLVSDEIFFENIKINYPVKSLGVSVYDPNDVEPTLICELNLACQFPANILDRRFEKNIYPLGKRYSRSIFLQGLLANPKNINHKAPQKLIDFHKKYHKIINNEGLNPLNLALSYINNCNYMDYFLIGAELESQLVEVLETKSFNLINDLTLFDSLISEISSKSLDPRQWN